MGQKVYPFELEINDISGMSNPVFFTSLVGTDAKIVFRYFDSAAANFEIENKVFAITS